MPRLLFEKTGEAVYISHLDLMRLFQRAFKRAGLPLTHTQGFNPRPSVSIALPLSVGVDSRCELLDFDISGEPVPCCEIKDRLNGALVEGVRVLDVYDSGRKIRELALLDCAVAMEYDCGVPEGAVEEITKLFAQNSLSVEKKEKNRPVQQDIIPMIRKFAIAAADENTLMVSARICCQNPTLNPAKIVSAVEKYLPHLTPDFFRCSRLEIYDNQEKIFR